MSQRVYYPPQRKAPRFPEWRGSHYKGMPCGSGHQDTGHDCKHTVATAHRQRAPEGRESCSPPPTPLPCTAAGETNPRRVTEGRELDTLALLRMASPVKRQFHCASLITLQSFLLPLHISSLLFPTPIPEQPLICLVPL